MRQTIIIALLAGAVFAGTPHDQEIERIAKMREALNTRTIEGFMEDIRANQWAAPRIPSKWFVEARAADEDERRVLRAARDFGRLMVLRLEGLGKEQWALRSRDALSRRTLLLYDLGDWCAGTVGYGNLFLALECDTFARTGLNRLIASLEFPIEKCEGLATRLNPEWQGKSCLLQVLNDEAGATIFISTDTTYDQLNGLWNYGCRALDRAEYPEKWEDLYRQGIRREPPPNDKFVNAMAFTNNLHFFANPEMSQEAITLFQSWDLRQHKWLIVLTARKSMLDDTQNFLKYRSLVGFFPPPFVRTEEETRRRDAEIAEAAKWGRKITKSELSPSYDPLKIAFRREWEKHVTTVEELNTHWYMHAVYLYKAVTADSILDED